MAPGHYLNQCWNIVNWTLGNKLQWNFNRNSNIFIEENTFENVVCEMLFISSRPQCVKHSWIKNHLFFESYTQHTGSKWLQTISGKMKNCLAKCQGMRFSPKQICSWILLKTNKFCCMIVTVMVFLITSMFILFIVKDHVSWETVSSDPSQSPNFTRSSKILEVEENQFCPKERN